MNDRRYGIAILRQKASTIAAGFEDDVYARVATNARTDSSVHLRRRLTPLIALTRDARS
jgi:hypothetical protein